MKNVLRSFSRYLLTIAQRTKQTLEKFPKDTTESLEKSRLYEINGNDYTEKYNDQNLRAIRTGYGSYKIRKE